MRTLNIKAHYLQNTYEMICEFSMLYEVDIWGI